MFKITILLYLNIYEFIFSDFVGALLQGQLMFRGAVDALETVVKDPKLQAVPKHTLYLTQSFRCQLNRVVNSDILMVGSGLKKNLQRVGFDFILNTHVQNYS